MTHSILVDCGRAKRNPTKKIGSESEAEVSLADDFVLEQFFARYVSVNSFTETVVDTIGRGEIMRWPARIGTRHII